MTILWDDREPVIIQLRRTVKGGTAPCPPFSSAEPWPASRARPAYRAAPQPLHKPFGFHSRSGVVGGLPESCRMRTSALR